MAASTEVVSNMIDSFLVCALFVGIQSVSRQTQTTKKVYISYKILYIVKVLYGYEYQLWSSPRHKNILRDLRAVIHPILLTPDYIRSNSYYVVTKSCS